MDSMAEMIPSHPRDTAGGRSAPDRVAEEFAATLRQLDAIAIGTKELRGDTRERVLDAAITHLATEGFSSMSMRKLSAAVGITAAGIYSHFDSKEAILGAGLARSYSEFLRFVFRVGDDGSAELDLPLPVITERHMRFQIERRDIAESSDRLLGEQVLERFLDADTVATFRGAQRFYATQVRNAIARYRGRSSLDASVEAEAILTLCDSVKGGPRTKPIRDDEQLIADYLVVIDRVLRVNEVP